MSAVDQGLGTVHSIIPAAVTPLASAVSGWPEQPGAAALIADPRSKLWTTGFVLDARGRATRIDRPLETSDRYTRNAAGEVVGHIDPLFRRTTYTYHGPGNLTRTDYPDGTSTHTAYHTKFHSPTVETDKRGYSIIHMYEALGQRTSTTDRTGHRTDYTYASSHQKSPVGGLVHTVTDPRGNVTTYQYTGRQLTAKVDPYFNQTIYSYDTRGNPSKVQDENKHWSLTSYDGLNRLRFETDPLGNPTTHTYTAAGLPESQVDPKLLPSSPAHRETVTTYDRRGFARTTVEKSVGGTPALARTTVWEYDQAGNVLTETRRRAYDGASLIGEQSTITTKYDYNALNHRVRTIEGFGTDRAVTRHADYDRAGRLMWETQTQYYGLSDIVNPSIDTTSSYIYDWADRQIRITEADYDDEYEKSTFISYDKNGNGVRVLSPLGAVTVSDYNVNNQLIWTTEAANRTHLSRTTQWSYDSAGNLLAVRDALNQVTTYAYDKLNRVEQKIEAFGNKAYQLTTHYRYDAVGNLLAVSTPRGYDYAYAADGKPAVNWGVVPDEAARAVVTSYGYDPANRRTVVIEGSNLMLGGFNPSANAVPTSLLPHQSRPQTAIAYDAAGRVVRVVDPLGRVQQTTYDVFGRKVREDALREQGANAKASGRWTVWDYDAADNVRSETTGSDVPGVAQFKVTTTYAYDVRNRLVGMTQAALTSGVPYPLTHHQPFATQDVELNTQDLAAPPIRTTYLLDAAGNILRVTDPRGTVEKTTYDPHNRVLTRTEAWGTFDVRSTTITHDLQDRIIHEATDRSHLGQMLPGPAELQTRYDYDSLNRQTHVTVAANEPTARTARTVYDALDRRVAEIVPTGLLPSQFQTTLFSYDPLGRLTHHVEAAGTNWQRTSFTNYDAADNAILEVRPRAYDGAGLVLAPEWRPQTVRYFDGLNRLSAEVSAANVEADRLGHQPPVQRWQYDLAGQVIAELAPRANDTDSFARGVRHQFDVFGQVTLSEEGVYTFDIGQFTPLRFEAKGYDGAGHLVEHLRGGVSAGAQVAGGPLVPHLSITTYAYDALGRLGRQVDSISPDQPARVTDYRYDANGNPTLMTVRRPSYYPAPDGADPAAWKLIQRQDTKFVHDRLNRQVAVVQAYADSTVEGLNTNHLGHSSPSTFTVYDATDNPIQVTDPRGVVTRFEYDLFGNVIRERRATAYPSDLPATHFIAPVINYEYDRANRLVRVTDPKSIQTEFQYDALGRWTIVIEAVGRLESRRAEYVYDAAGAVLQVTTGLAMNASALTASGLPYNRPVSTSYTYDALGRQRTVSGAAQLANSELAGNLGHSRPTTSTNYDATGNRVEIITNTSRPGLEMATRTVRSYDELGRLIQTTEAAATENARIIKARYDAADNLIWLQTATAAPTVYVYDGLNRKTVTIGAAGVPGQESRVTVQYDVWSNAVLTQTEQTTTTMQYDRLGRATLQIHNPQHETAFTYDAAGNRLSVRDRVLPTYYASQGAANPSAIIVSDQWRTEQPTATQYDPLGRVATTDLMGQQTSWIYDASGLTREIVDRNGRRRLFNYDALNRRIAEEWIAAPGKDFADDGRGYAYEFDSSDGPMVSYATQENAGRRYEHRQTFDGMGRLKEDHQLVGLGIPRLVHIYDAVGRQHVVSDAQGGELRSDYDQAGRLVQRNLSAVGKALSFTFTYHPAGDIHGSDGKTDLLHKIHVFASPTAAGPPSAHIVKHYDLHGRVTLRGTYRGADATPQTVLDAYSYNLRPATGLVTAEHRDGPADLNQATTYTYDTRGQVKTSQVNGGVVEPTNLDAAGNPPYGLPEESAGSNRAKALAPVGNRLSLVNGIEQEYDDEGNVISQQVRVAAGTTTERTLFRYDHRNRLVAVIRGSIVYGQAPSMLQAEVEVRYGYDGDNRLVERVTFDYRSARGIAYTLQRYVSVNGHVYADANAAGVVTDRYVHQDGVDLPLGRLSATEQLLYATDRQGSVGAIYDLLLVGGVQLVKVVAYQGPRAGSRGSWVAGGVVAGVALADRYEYTGREFDGVSGLQFNRARWFDPRTGRFVTEDPIGFAGGDTNLYRYAFNSWPNATDPTGHAAWGEAWLERNLWQPLGGG